MVSPLSQTVLFRGVKCNPIESLDSFSSILNPIEDIHSLSRAPEENAYL